MRKVFVLLLTAACFLTGCMASQKVDYIESGTELLRQGEYEAAIETFEKATASAAEQEEKGNKEEQVYEAYRGIGLAYYACQEYADALENLQRALEEGGRETPVIYNLMGICSMNLADYDGALVFFDKGISLPALSEEEGQEEKSGTDFSAIIQEMRFNTILCYEKKRDWESAKQAAKEYVRDYPDDGKVRKEAEFLETR